MGQPVIWVDFRIIQWEDRELAEGSVNYADKDSTNPRLFQADQKGPKVLRKRTPHCPNPC